MSPKAKHAISMTTGLLLLGGIGYGIFLIASATIHFVTSVKSDVAVAIIAAAATVLVSVMTIVVGKIYESRWLIEKEHREKKTPVYEDLIKFMFRIVMGGKAGNAPSEKEIIKFMIDFTQRGMIWGSDEVLAAWINWRRCSLDDNAIKANPAILMLYYERLILAIRRDLGHKNKGLKQGDILTLFINDLDKYVKDQPR